METLFRARRRTPEVEPVSDIWDDGLVAAAPLPQEEFQPTLNGKQVSFFKQVLDMPAPEEGPAPGTYFANKAKSRSSKSKKEEVPASPPAAKPVASDNVYVQYLPPDCGDEELFNLFSQVGEVKSCRVIMDFEKNRSKGYGFVLFARPEDAQRSVESYNGLPYNGKRLMVRLADHSPSATSNQSNATATASPADVVEVSTKSASSKQHWRETELKQHFGVYGLQSIRSARILVDDAPAAVANVPTQAVAATQNEPKPSTTFVETDRQSQAHAVSASTFGFRQRDNNRTGIESTAHAFGPSCWCGGSRCVEDLGLKLNRQDSTPMAEAPSSYPSAQELYEQFQVTPGSRNVRLPGLAPCAPGAVLCRPPTHLVNTAAVAGIQFYRHDPYMMGNSYAPAMDRTGSGSSHQRRTWAPTV